MNLLQSIVVISVATLLSPSSIAGVFKCTDEQGNTAYQSAPCADEINAAELNVKTGSSKALSIGIIKKNEEELLKEQQEAEIKKQKEREALRIKNTKEQSALNQLLVQNNPIQFSAYAIPPYLPEKLSDTVNPFESRLPEIEKFRRLAAQKALATGECRRVESDELSIKSKLDLLVFSIDCSSAKTFHYTEVELAK